MKKKLKEMEDEAARLKALQVPGGHWDGSWAGLVVPDLREPNLVLFSMPLPAEWRDSRRSRCSGGRRCRIKRGGRLEVDIRKQRRLRLHTRGGAATLQGMSCIRRVEADCKLGAMPWLD
jgi:hypothetical protein